MEDLRRRPSGRAKIPVLNTFAKAGDIENTKRIVAMYTAQGHTPDAEVRNIILSAYINHPGESMWEEIKKFYENNYGQKNCKADYHTFRFLLRACEKYRNRDAAFAWYEEALNLHVSTAGLKSILRHTVGANEFEKYCNRQSPESLEGSESPVSEGMILDNKDPLTSTDTPDTTLISSAGLLEMAASAIQVLREVKVKVVSETIYVEARASAPTFIESIQGNNREEARAEAAFQQFASMLPRSVSAPVPVPAPVSAPVQPVRREIPEVCEAATDHEESLEESVGESFDESYDESDSTGTLSSPFYTSAAGVRQTEDAFYCLIPLKNTLHILTKLFHYY